LGGGIPCIEVLESEKESGKTHYDRVAEFYKKNPDFSYGYNLSRFFDGTELTREFYQGRF
jgi:hypothetical protein